MKTYKKLPDPVQGDFEIRLKKTVHFRRILINFVAHFLESPMFSAKFSKIKEKKSKANFNLYKLSKSLYVSWAGMLL